MEWAVSEVRFSPESKGGKVTERSEVGLGLRLDGDHRGSEVWWQKGWKGHFEKPVGGVSRAAPLQPASVAATSSCVQVAAGNRENGWGERGDSQFHVQAQGAALLTGHLEREVSDGAGKVPGAPQAQDMARNSLHGRC